MLDVLTHTHNYLLFVLGCGLIYTATSASDRGLKLVACRVSCDILLLSSFKLHYILSRHDPIYKLPYLKKCSTDFGELNLISFNDYTATSLLYT